MTKPSHKASVVLGISTCVLVSVAAFAERGDPVRDVTYGHGGRLEQFDSNHDGKITHDELNRSIAARFSSITHGARAMTLDQFVSSRMGGAAERIAQTFRRLDWNGDGKLSFDEYAGPQRARFEAMDSDGKGTESCEQGAFESAAYRTASFRRNSFGRARFCAENDLNHDGVVTHAEFDGVAAKRFASSTAGAKAMTLAQFTFDTLARYRQSDARIFGYIDRDHDGQLTLAEFAASDEKLFARLDRNGDGTVTRDEMASDRDGYSYRARRQSY
jgi:Ca2+-binding EF-hand superfamily protein